jgi:hypothetical protein
LLTLTESSESAGARVDAPPTLIRATIEDQAKTRNKELSKARHTLLAGETHRFHEYLKESPKRIAQLRAEIAGLEAERRAAISRVRQVQDGIDQFSTFMLRLLHERKEAEGVLSQIAALTGINEGNVDVVRCQLEELRARHSLEVAREKLRASQAGGVADDRESAAGLRLQIEKAERDIEQFTIACEQLEHVDQVLANAAHLQKVMAGALAQAVRNQAGVEQAVNPLIALRAAERDRLLDGIAVYNSLASMINDRQINLPRE